MSETILYQVAIVGGGLGGLTLSIQLAKQGIAVVLFEKKKYPFHKVCGEYISLESKPFLERCGIDFSKWDIPIITELSVSAPNGRQVKQHLPLGGFGISRYSLDAELKTLALKNGVSIYENTTVHAVTRLHKDQYTLDTSNGMFTAQLVVGSYGKRSNLDIKFQRSFIKRKPHALANFIGVKYHIKVTQGLANEIQLHNFKNGYCGFSKVEGNTWCLCYLTTAANLQEHGSIEALEREVLSQNPHLKAILESSQKLYNEPLTISNIDFSKKELMKDGVIFLGDAAGMITPLCGNGMSIAMHASHHLSKLIPHYLNGVFSVAQLLERYTQFWKKNFAKRLWVGRLIQRSFGRPVLSNWVVRFFAVNKKLLYLLIRQTHGKTF